MQHRDEKTKHLSKVIGEVIKELRENNLKASINKVAHEFELDVGNTSRIENGLIEAKVVTLWKISEALGLPLSELVKIVEQKVSSDFHFYED